MGFELRDWLTIIPLLFLAARSAFLWIAGREAADSDHAKQIRKLEDQCDHLARQIDTEVADRRKLWHDVDNRLHGLLVADAVTETRLRHLEQDHEKSPRKV